MRFQINFQQKNPKQTKKLKWKIQRRFKIKLKNIGKEKGECLHLTHLSSKIRHFPSITSKCMSNVTNFSQLLTTVKKCFWEVPESHMTAIWNIACLVHPSIFISFSTIFSHLTTTAKMSIIDVWRGPK